MKKIEFQDYPSTETPLNAVNLNQVQTNVENAINEVDTKVNGIIESGSNNNGSYIKFNDGTMICYGINNGVNESYRGFSFPQSFISKPILNVNSIIADINYMTYAQIIELTKSSAKVSIYWKSRNDTSGALAIGGNEFYWMAIGKWK